MWIGCFDSVVDIVFATVIVVVFVVFASVIVLFCFDVRVAFVVCCCYC